MLSIKDNGGGIAKDIQNKIFEPFFTTKRPGDGTGLGLSVSGKIISDAGGRIELEPEEGKGSTFKVILPYEIPRRKQRGIKRTISFVTTQAAGNKPPTDFVSHFK